MPAAAKTPNYELNQWAGNEYPKRQDFVDDNSIVDTALAGINTALNNHKVDYTLQVPFGGTTTNSGNAYAIAAPAISALTAGMAIAVKINVDSTGAATLNWNNTGAKAVKKANGMAVSNLKANGIYTMRYDGTNFILQGEGASGNATASDLRSGKTATVDAGEITGTLALTGDAVAANVLAGKFFYSSDLDTKIEGTMVGKGGNTAATAMYALANLITDGSFAALSTNWTAVQANTSATYKFGATSVQLHSSNGIDVASVEQDFYVQANHIYYGSIWALKGAAGSLGLSGEFDVYSATIELGNGPLTDTELPSSSVWYHRSWRSSTALSGACKARVYTFSTHYLYADGYLILDLTEIFGSGNEPSQATMDAFIESIYGGFFDGTEIITKIPSGAYLTNGFTGAPDLYYSEDDLRPINIRAGTSVLGVLGTLPAIKSIQMVEVTIAVSATSGTATISSVNVDNTIIFLLGFCPYKESAATININHIATRVTLTNSTSITANRNTATSAYSIKASVLVVEFEAGSVKSKQSGTVINSTADNDSDTATLSPAVSVNKTLLGYCGYSSTTTVDNGQAVGSSIKLTNSTTLTVAKYVDEGSYTTSWNLIEFY